MCINNKDTDGDVPSKYHQIVPFCVLTTCNPSSGAVHSSKTLVTTYQTTLSHYPEDHNVNFRDIGFEELTAVTVMHYLLKYDAI